MAERIPPRVGVVERNAATSRTDELSDCRPAWREAVKAAPPQRRGARWGDNDGEESAERLASRLNACVEGSFEELSACQERGDADGRAAARCLLGGDWAQASRNPDRSTPTAATLARWVKASAETRTQRDQRQEHCVVWRDAGI